MSHKELIERVSNALENELNAIYNEIGISSGDIPPWEQIEWDSITYDAALLFAKLIEFNKE